MEAEIELKLFFRVTEQKNLIKLLDSLPYSESKGVAQLTNAYYDTQDLQLRKWDMGLRVRGVNGHREQTIKTAGRVVGGVHSRPEYNLDIDHDFPDLFLFPEKIWPQNAQLERVQSQLACVFHTDFSRQRWHIYVDNSLVEVALDIGSIRAHDASEAICELEFELLAGDTQALLTLATRVSHSIPVRVGRASKAQRGYRLAAQASPLSLEVLDFIALEADQSLKQASTGLLEVALERWQQLEAMILESFEQPQQTPILCYRLRACIRLLKSTLSQFNLLAEDFERDFECVETHLSFIEEALSLAEILEHDSALVAKLPEANTLARLALGRLEGMGLSERLAALHNDICYGRLQLHLVALLMKLSAGQISVSKEQPLRYFADKMQEASWQEIVTLMPMESDLSSADYQSLAKALDDSICVGVAYGTLYSTKSRDQFRAPWQDLVLGIRTLAAYRQLRLLSEAGHLDIHDWLENKEQSLVQAMEFSRRSAMQKTPYWR